MQPDTAVIDPTSNFRKQAIRFLFVGGSCVAVDLICYSLLLPKLDMWAAKGISYLAGVLVGFVGNKFWTFESKAVSYAEPLIYLGLYAVTWVVNMGINSGIYRLSLPGIHSTKGMELIAFFCATAVTTVLNFVGLRYLAFRQTAIRSC